MQIVQILLDTVLQDAHPGVDVSSVDIEGEEAADGDHLTCSAGSHSHETDDDD